jgi:hypothetical protein
MNELLDYKKQVNAEFKNLRLRILKLEEILLKQKIDSGSLNDPVKRLKKG